MNPTINNGKMIEFNPFPDNEESNKKELLRKNGIAPIVTFNPEFPNHSYVVGTTARGKSTWICDCEKDYIRSRFEECCDLCKCKNADYTETK